MAMIPIYHRGEWTEGPSPIPEDTEDFEAAWAQAGFDQFDTTAYFAAPDEFAGRTIALTIHTGRGDSNPRYILEFEIANSSFIDDYIGAQDTIDLMDLMARWLPAIQAGAQLDKWHAEHEETQKKKLREYERKNPNR